MRVICFQFKYCSKFGLCVVYLFCKPHSAFQVVAVWDSEINRGQEAYIWQPRCLKPAVRCINQFNV